jgi:uncharacterized peroxidase-related enzyme
LKNDALTDQIKKDYKTADLSERQRALCEFAEKLTLTPAKMTAEDLNPLRAAELSDRDILDVVQVISYFNYINRIADGLGVDPEAWMKQS